MTEFDRFQELLDYPMYVVTAAVGEERAGCLVGFATQCSIDPPRFMVWLSVANHTYTVADRADHLAVHLLDRRRSALAALFGGETGDRTDKFARVAWQPRGPAGTPVLDGAAAWFIGRVLERTPAGDHVGFLLDVTEVGPAGTDPAQVLAFRDARGIEAGHPA